MEVTERLERDAPDRPLRHLLEEGVAKLENAEATRTIP